MISLMQLCHIISAEGVIELYALSRQLKISADLLESMLEQLVTLNKIKKQLLKINYCQGCSGCGATKTCFRPVYYRYIKK